jgi:hypothetical protein
MSNAAHNAIQTRPTPRTAMTAQNSEHRTPPVILAVGDVRHRIATIGDTITPWIARLSSNYAQTIYMGRCLYLIGRDFGCNYDALLTPPLARGNCAAAQWWMEFCRRASRCEAAGQPLRRGLALRHHSRMRVCGRGRRYVAAQRDQGSARHTFATDCARGSPEAESLSNGFAGWFVGTSGRLGARRYRPRRD